MRQPGFYRMALLLFSLLSLGIWHFMARRRIGAFFEMLMAKFLRSLSWHNPQIYSQGARDYHPSRYGKRFLILILPKSVCTTSFGPRLWTCVHNECCTLSCKIKSQINSSERIASPCITKEIPIRLIQNQCDQDTACPHVTQLVRNSLGTTWIAIIRYN